MDAFSQISSFSPCLQAENKRLTETSLRSELENEVLALELVTDRVQLKGTLHRVSRSLFVH